MIGTISVLSSLLVLPIQQRDLLEKIPQIIGQESHAIHLFYKSKYSFINKYKWTNKDCQIFEEKQRTYLQKKSKINKRPADLRGNKEMIQGTEENVEGLT